MSETRPLLERELRRAQDLDRKTRALLAELDAQLAESRELYAELELPAWRRPRAPDRSAAHARLHTIRA